VVAVAAVIGSYPYWWAQATALSDQITNSILTIPEVSQGLYKLMDYAVGGVALGGWQLIDLGLMGAIALELLGLIFLKVVLILLGALLYATGPMTIGLVPTRAGSALARAWTSAVLTLLGIGVAWATLFAVGALLIGDAGTAGPLIAGHTSVGALLGGVLLAVAGAASLWICLRAAREAMGLLRMQLGGLLALSHRGSPGAARAAAPHSSAVSSMRRFGAKVGRAASGAAGELASAGAGGSAVVRGGRAVGYVSRHGVIGTAASGGRAAAAAAGPHTAALVGRSRAGAVAVRMAKSGTAGWYAAAGKVTAAAPAGAAAREPGQRFESRRASERSAPPPAQSSPGASSRPPAAAGANSQGSAVQTRERLAPRQTASSATRPGAAQHRNAAPHPGRPAASEPQPPARNFTPPPPGGSRPGRGKR